MTKWIAHCQTCNWTGKRCRERAPAKEERDDHLKKHPEHKVHILENKEFSAKI